MIQDYDEFQNIYKMLAYAFDEVSDTFGSDSDWVDSDKLPLEFYVIYFEQICSKLYCEESISYYRVRELGTKPKGKINISLSVSRGYVDSGRLAYSYSRINFNNDITRTIKCAIRVLNQCDLKRVIKRYSGIIKQTVENSLEILRQFDSEYLSNVDELDTIDVMGIVVCEQDFERSEIIAYKSALKILQIVCNDTYSINNELYDTSDIIKSEQMASMIFEAFVRGVCRNEFSEDYIVTRSNLCREQQPFYVCQTDVTMISKRTHHNDVIIETKYGKQGFDDSKKEFYVTREGAWQLVTYCTRYLSERKPNRVIGIIVTAVTGNRMTREEIDVENTKSEQELLNGNELICARVVNMRDDFDVVKMQLEKIIRKAINRVDEHE